jgi:hypothetical protein
VIDAPSIFKLIRKAAALARVLPTFAFGWGRICRTPRSGGDHMPFGEKKMPPPSRALEEGALFAGGRGVVEEF